MKSWKLEIKHQETVIIARWRTSLNIQEQHTVTSRPNTLSMDELLELSHSTSSYNSLETRVQPDIAQKEFQSSFTICMNICNDFKFNDMQWVAFLVAANSWLTLHAYHDLCSNTLPHSNNDMKEPEPLCMFLTGPGGTGKTYVIGELKSVAEFS